MAATSRGLDYRRAGVDIDAADRLVRRIGLLAATTRRSGVLAGIGPFAAAMRIPRGYHNPVLLTSTDGVGTKLLIARLADKHDTIGIDLVAMCVNDILTTGARSLCFLDYLATAHLADIDAETIIRGIAEGCRIAGTSLVGGETAEMPGLYARGDYDLAGFAVGIVERRRMITGKGVCPGQMLIGLPSNGLHSNGFSLARVALGLDSRKSRQRTSSTLLEELLRPTTIYVRPVLAALERFPIKAMAHITGGGIPGNLVRVLPPGTAGVIYRNTLPRLDLLERVRINGKIEQREMDRSFNGGVGYVLILPRTAADRTCEFFRRRRIFARVIGEVVEGRRRIRYKNRR